MASTVIADNIEVDSEFPPDVYTRHERNVLKNGTIRKKYRDLTRSGRAEEAKCFLHYEVYISQVYEENSRRGVAEDSQAERLLLKRSLSHQESVESDEIQTDIMNQEIKMQVRDEVDHLGSQQTSSFRRKWRQMKSLVNSDHLGLITKIFSLNVLLVTADIVTDIAVSSQFFATNDFYWGLITTLLIMAPIFARILLQFFEILKSLFNKNFTLSQSLVRGIPLVLSQQHPISNLRYFFGLLLMDPSLPQNSALVARIDNTVLVSGFFQTYLQSAPQFILQCAIVLRTGYITITQCLGIPISFLMIVIFSTRLYFYQRLERFQDLNPSLKMLFFVMPFITVQVTANLVTLTMAAAYFKGYSIICVLITILLNAIVLTAYFSFKKGVGISQSVYVKSKKDPVYVESLRQAQIESHNMFLTAVSTSWISPCTVWANNFNKRTKFLLISSACSFFSNLMCLVSIYVYLNIIPQESFTPQNVPITHCFHRETGNSTLGPMVSMRPSNATHSKMRICLEDESPVEFFTRLIGPLILCFLCQSIVSSLALHNLSDYLKMYKASKAMFSGMPLIHTSLIHDYLRNFATLSQQLRSEMPDVFSFAITFEKKVLSQQDRFGETALHAALSNNLFEQVYQMLCAGADFDIKDGYGNSALDILQEKYYTLKKDSKENLETLEKILYKLKFEDKRVSHHSLWKERNPLNNSVVSGKLNRMAFFQSIGGQVGAVDRDNKGCHVLLLKQFEENRDELLKRSNLLVKHWIARGRDEFGQTILHVAAKENLARSLQILVQQHADVNAKVGEDGSSPLHFAAMNGHEECLEILLQNKANVNAVNFLKYTALHDAAGAGHFKSVRLLVHHGADVNAQNQVGSTPLHLAALWGHVKCVNFLLDCGADVNMKNKENNTALHEAVWTVPDLTNLEAKDICCRLLLEHGADVNVKNKLGKSPADFELLKHFRFSESDSIKG